MVNADPPSLGGTGATRNAPAPWVPYTRAGCDVGNVGVANTVLENNTAIVLRTAARTRWPADAAIGATNIKVDERDRPRGGPDDRDRDRARRERELATIAAVGTAGASRHRCHPDAPARQGTPAAGSPSTTATDPTGDMTKVFGAGSPEWNEGRDSQIAPPDTAARSARADRLRRHRHPLRRRRRHLHRQPATRSPTRCPTSAGGYTGFQALFGAKYVNPAINGGVGVGQRHGRPARSSTRSTSRASRASTACTRRTRSATSRRCRSPASR